ncbi:MAG: energy-coupling factor transporter transmembrane protein EcfT [Clostridia bacterium]|nr:energy-coupling factor transporter transmembrane protein EcfT [Clostridia bacterium]
MKDVAIGQLYPVDSPIHRLDPRVKFVVTIAYIVMLFFAQSFILFGIITVGLIAVIFLSRIPLSKVLRSIRFIIFLLVFTFIITLLLNKGEGAEAEIAKYGYYLSFGPFTICGTGLLNAGKLCTRLILIVVGPTLLTLTTSPTDLTEAIAWILSPFKLIRLPVHEFAMIMSLALRLVPTVMEETEKIMNAQKARGASFDHGNIFKRAGALVPVLVPLFVNSMKRSDELANAMESRCYRGAKGRTKMKKLRFRFKDVFAFFLFALFMFFILMVACNWFGWEWCVFLNTY